MVTLYLLRHGKPETMEDNPLWLIVLCDMMTNLMLFFLVMYSFTLLDPKSRDKWAKSFLAADVVEDPKEARAKVVLRQFHEKEAGGAIDELLRRDAVAKLSEVSMTQHSIRVRLRNQMLFSSAAAELNPEASQSLSALARVLREMPNEVIVEGHTDNVPIVSGRFKTNWELSVARSYAVIERLISEGVAPARLISSGYGPLHPVTGNSSPEGRGRNRRVEIVILRGKDDQ